MKKLMITAAAVAMTAGAFAAPAVYDFKASVKHMYLKEVRVNIRGGFQGVVYQKYQKSASLKGYLVQDMDGLTSRAITANWTTPAASACTDVGRSRSFLVVQNSSAERAVRAPKVLPAVLDAKYLDTKFTAANQSTTGLAEGYLFVGGDMIAAVTPHIDMVKPAPLGVEAPVERAAANEYAYADYAWTSIYLFGQFNGPNWYRIATPATPFPTRESNAAGCWDAALPAVPVVGAYNGLQRGVAADGSTVGGTIFNFYHDTWMNGSGVGKYFIPSATTAGQLCCGLRPTRTTYVPTLDSLSGNLKGGIFICTENGIAARDDRDPATVGYVGDVYDFFDLDQHRWEDQFVANRVIPAGTFAPDGWQNDIWLDGGIDQWTTDVVYGTWSIKFNRKFLGDNGAFVQYQNAVVAGTTTNPAAGNEVGSVVCAAAWSLNRNVRMSDGTEIWEMPSGGVAPLNDRFAVPFLTPQFMAYYGLNAGVAE